jgi:hypothetical protein
MNTYTIIIDKSIKFNLRALAFIYYLGFKIVVRRKKMKVGLHCVYRRESAHLLKVFCCKNLSIYHFPFLIQKFRSQILPLILSLPLVFYLSFILKTLLVCYH